MRISFVIAITLVIGFQSCTSFTPENEVKKTYTNYVRAVSSLKGEEVIPLIDSASIAHFETIRDLALNADSSSVYRLNLMDQIDVLCLRANYTRSELEELSGQDIVVQNVEQMNPMHVNPSLLKIERVVISGDDAAAQVSYDQTAFTGAGVYFSKENGVWKVDLKSLRQLWNKIAVVVLKSQGMNTEQFVSTFFDKALGREFDAKYWHPIAD